MNDKEFKEKLDAFKNSCRVYKHEKEMMEEHMRNAGKDFADKKLTGFLEEDIRYVEDMFERIKERCGNNARLMIWLMFVEERTQQDVAQQYGLTRRQLQYSLNKWMHMVL